MPLVPAKCTQCGSNLTVEPSQEATICPFCNTPFITEKAINNYNTTNNIKADVVNVFQTKESDFIIRGGVLEEYRGNNPEVYIPDNVVEIKKRAFAGCSGITKIFIPDCVKTIGFEAFLNCISLEEVSLPKGIEKISASLFSGCKNLKNIDIPESVIYIESHAFLNCENLTEVILPKGLKIIEESTFQGCLGLKNIRIPDDLEYIRHAAFKGCVSLRNIDIPQSIKGIASYYYDWEWSSKDGAFTGCKNLNMINNTDNPYEILNGITDASAFSGTPLFEKLQKQQWIQNGKCGYCGGKFKGVFNIVCENCKRKKDY